MASRIFQVLALLYHSLARIYYAVVRLLPNLEEWRESERQAAALSAQRHRDAEAVRDILLPMLRDRTLLDRAYVLRGQLDIGWDGFCELLVTISLMVTRVNEIDQSFYYLLTRSGKLISDHASHNVIPELQKQNGTLSADAARDFIEWVVDAGQHKRGLIPGLVTGSDSEGLRLYLGTVPYDASKGPRLYWDGYS